MPDMDDPFKPSDATVLRPRPGGGRRPGTPPQAGYSPPPGPGETFGAGARPGGYAEPVTSSAQQWLGLGLSPLIRAASPLLLLAGQLRSTLSVPDVAGLRRHALEEIRRFGPLAALRVFFAQRANSNEQWLVILRETRVIAVMDEANRLARDIEAGLRPAHPDALLDVGTQAFIRHRDLPDGGVRLIFALPVLAGCRACAFIAIARIAIDADASGAYRGAVSLGTVPASSGQDWASDPRL